MRHNREIYAWEQGVYSSFFGAHAGGVRSAPLRMKTSSPGPPVLGPDPGVAMMGLVRPKRNLLAVCFWVYAGTGQPRLLPPCGGGPRRGVAPSYETSERRRIR
jgi:hypothetical protein